MSEVEAISRGSNQPATVRMPNERELYCPTFSSKNFAINFNASLVSGNWK